MTATSSGGSASTGSSGGALRRLVRDCDSARELSCDGLDFAGARLRRGDDRRGACQARRRCGGSSLGGLRGELASAACAASSAAADSAARSASAAAAAAADAAARSASAAAATSSAASTVAASGGDIGFGGGVWLARAAS